MQQHIGTPLSVTPNARLRMAAMFLLLTLGILLGFLFRQQIRQQFVRNLAYVMVVNRVVTEQDTGDKLGTISMSPHLSPYAYGLLLFSAGDVVGAQTAMATAADKGDHRWQALYRQAEYAYLLGNAVDADVVMHELVGELPAAQAVAVVDVACNHRSVQTCVLLYNEILQRVDKRTLELQLLSLAIEGVSYRDAAAVQAWAERGIALVPMSAKFHHELAIALTRQRKYADAIIAGTRAKELGDKSARIDTFLGRAYHGVGEEEVALALLNDVVQREPRNPDAWFYLGEVYRTLGELEHARQAWQRVLTLNPSDARAIKALDNLDK